MLKDAMLLEGSVACLIIVKTIKADSIKVDSITGVDYYPCSHAAHPTVRGPHVRADRWGTQGPMLRDRGNHAVAGDELVARLDAELGQTNGLTRETHLEEANWLHRSMCVK